MTCHLYGRKPYKIALVHGGPGAAGSLHCAAQILAEKFGVIEPLQSAHSVNGQIEELHCQLCEAQAEDIVLLGHSWGAWLVLLYAARYSGVARKIIMVDSAPLEEVYVPQILTRRLARLEPNEQIQFKYLMTQLGDISKENMLQLQRMLTKTENYSIVDDSYSNFMDQQIYADVWPEAAEIRRQGGLHRAAGKINIPVYIIHGSYDPHPVQGVLVPMVRAGAEPETVILQKCGHNPFIERLARDKFYHIVENIVAGGK